MKKSLTGTNWKKGDNKMECHCCKREHTPSEYLEMHIATLRKVAGSAVFKSPKYHFYGIDINDLPVDLMRYAYKVVIDGKYLGSGGEKL